MNDVDGYGVHKHTEWTAITIPIPHPSTPLSLSAQHQAAQPHVRNLMNPEGFCCLDAGAGSGGGGAEGDEIVASAGGRGAAAPSTVAPA